MGFFAVRKLNQHPEIFGNRCLHDMYNFFSLLLSNCQVLTVLVDSADQNLKTTLLLCNIFYAQKRPAFNQVFKLLSIINLPQTKQGNKPTTKFVWSTQLQFWTIPDFCSKSNSKNQNFWKSTSTMLIIKIDRSLEINFKFGMKPMSFNWFLPDFNPLRAPLHFILYLCGWLAI